MLTLFIINLFISAEIAPGTNIFNALTKFTMVLIGKWQVPGGLVRDVVWVSWEGQMPPPPQGFLGGAK